jgi:hypothetical protein
MACASNKQYVCFHARFLHRLFAIVSRHLAQLSLAMFRKGSPGCGVNSPASAAPGRNRYLRSCMDESGLRVLVARLQKESRSGHGGTPASNTGQSRAVLSLEAVSTPPAIWTKDRTSDQPGVALESGQELAVSSRFEEWRAERVGLLESRLQEIDAIASAGKLRRRHDSDFKAR